MRNLCAAGLLAAMLGPGAATAWCRQVQITFTAQVVTTTGTPFGLSNIRGKTMTGYFYYDTSTKDSKDTDPLRGLYDHNLSFSGFAASLDGTNFAGSKTPQVQIENIQNIDTMRFIDGFDPTKPNRIITANGVPLPTAAISLSISSDKNPLNGDLLPDPFPFKPTDTHTFSMNDKNGTMLMQFASLTDGSPAPASTIPVKISVTDARARFLVDGGAYTATKTFNWPPLSSHIIEFPVNDDGRQYNASQTSRWGFGGWNDVDGNLPSTGERAITVLATPGLQIVGTVGGFQHRFQMNFFGDAVDLQSFSATLASPPTCGSPGGDSPPTLRSGLVYMDGACYW